MTHKFGIEIEYVGMGHDRNRIARIIQSVSGVNVLGRGWAFKGDGSVQDHRRNRCLVNPNSSCGQCDGCFNTGGIELVSPPLPFCEDALLEVMQISEAIMASGGEANSTCGLHVHVDCRFVHSWPERVWAGFFQHIIDEYSKNEDIFDLFMNSTRQANQYCRSVKGLRYQSGMGRYFKLNVAAFPRHGTIEFRHHHGTVDHKEIIPWVKECVFFMQKARASYEAQNKSLVTTESIRTELQEMSLLLE